MGTKSNENRTSFKPGEREKVERKFFKTYFALDDAKAKLKAAQEQEEQIILKAEQGGNLPDDLRVVGRAASDRHTAAAKVKKLRDQLNLEADAIRHNGWLNEEQLELPTSHPDDCLDEPDDLPAADKKGPPPASLWMRSSAGATYHLFAYDAASAHCDEPRPTTTVRLDATLVDPKVERLCTDCIDSPDTKAVQAAVVLFGGKKKTPAMAAAQAQAKKRSKANGKSAEA